jgi:hypothetical protein
VAILFNHEGGSLSVVLRCRDGSHVNVIVIAEPSGASDWTVWHSSNPKLSRSGTANSPAEARAKAGVIAGLLMEAASGAARINRPPGEATSPETSVGPDDNGLVAHSRH